MFFKFKKQKKLHQEDQEELLRIIGYLKSTLTPETKLSCSYFESVEKLEEVLDELSEAVKAGDLNCLKDLNMYFLPTSSFQELSIRNGWSNEYLELASKFDRIHHKYK